MIHSGLDPQPNVGQACQRAFLSGSDEAGWKDCSIRANSCFTIRRCFIKRTSRATTKSAETSSQESPLRPSVFLCLCGEFFSATSTAWLPGGEPWRHSTRLAAACPLVAVSQRVSLEKQAGLCYLEYVDCHLFQCRGDMARFLLKEDLNFATIDEEEGIIFDPGAMASFSVNATGLSIIRKAEEGGGLLDTLLLAELLTTEFEVDLEQAAEDALRFCELLCDRGLAKPLEPADGP